MSNGDPTGSGRSRSRPGCGRGRWTNSSARSTSSGRATPAADARSGPARLADLLRPAGHAERRPWRGDRQQPAPASGAQRGRQRDEGSSRDARRGRAELETGGQRTILFVDELHRFNKAQQDVLLPDVERAWSSLIGATTENPFFAINSPVSEPQPDLHVRAAVARAHQGAPGDALCPTASAGMGDDCRPGRRRTHWNCSPSPRRRPSFTPA